MTKETKMIRQSHHLLGLLSVFWLVISTSILVADTFPAPTGQVVLTISGDIGRTNVGDTAAFDMDMLHALERTELETTTIWTDGMQHFAGVELGTLMKHIDVSNGVIGASALNEYFIDIPFEDAETGRALIAYERNGEPMSVRDKGPLWVIYPYDQSAQYRSEVYFSRSIWQMDRIEIER